MINWPRFVEIVRNHQRFLLTTHVRPDCDALGSQLAKPDESVWVIGRDGQHPCVNGFCLIQQSLL